MDKKQTLSEEFGYEESRLTLEEVMALESEEDNDEMPLSKYTKMWLTYMEEENPFRLDAIILDGMLPETLQRVDDEILARIETLEEAYRKNNPKPQQDMLQAIQYEQNLRSYVEELILDELVYKMR